MSKQENNIVLAFVGPLVIIGLALLCFIVPYIYIVLPMAGLIIDIRTGKFTGIATVLAIATAFTIMIGIDILPLTLPLVLVTIVALILLKTGISPTESLLATTATAAISMAGGMYILSLVHNMSITAYLIQLILNWMNNIPDSGVAHYFLSTITLALNGIEGGSIDLTETMKSVLEFQSYPSAKLVELIAPYVESTVKFNVPGMVIKTSLYMGVVSYGVPIYMIKLRRAKGMPIADIAEKIPDVPKFKDWDLPNWIKYPLLLTMVLSIVAQFMSNDEILVIASRTLNSLVMGIGAIEGLALINYWLDKKKVGKGGTIALMAISLVLFRTIVSYFGLFDMVTGIRRFWNTREALIKDITSKIDKKKDSDEEEKK